MSHTQHEPIVGEVLHIETRLEARRPYTKPEIVHELELQTRAGSPLGIPDPMGPFDLEPRE